MTTPNTNVTFSSIQTEFGGVNPIALNEYYAGGGLVAPGVVGVPTSGTISVDDLRNKTQIVYGTLTPSLSSAEENGVTTVTFNLTGVSGLPNGTTLYWKLSGTNITGADFSGGSLTGSFTISGGAGSFAVTPVGDGIIEGTESFVAMVGTALGVPIAYVTSSSVNITETQTFSVTWDTGWAGYLVEGGTQRVKLSTGNVAPDSTQYYFVIVPSGTYPIESSGDVSPMSGSLGTLSITSGSFAATPFSPTLTFSNDLTYESPGYESFRVSIRSGSTAGPEVATTPDITIFDQPSYSLTWSPASTTEGSYPTLTLNTYNVAPSQTFYYTLSGTATSADMPGIFSGSTITTNGSGTSAVQHGITYDGSSEGTETLVVTLREGSTSGSILATSNTLNITDATGSVGSATSTGWAYTTPINIYGQITYIAPNVADRYFAVWGDYGGGWYSVGVNLYVPAGATSSASTLLYSAATATAGVTYYIELRLTGHTTYSMGPFYGYI